MVSEKLYKQLVGERKLYKIMHEGKRYNSKTFDSYEKARQYIRRWMTKNVGTDYYNEQTMKGGMVTCAPHDPISKNYPSIGVWGFSIQRIA
jgi:hypothetical protein